jgi:FkbM family methyltransferase
MLKKNLNSTILELGNLSIDDICLLVGKDDPVIIEVGANIGQTTMEFMKKIPNAKIYCFEPDPRAALKFRENIPDNANIRLFECAVGDINGSVTFHQSSGEGENKDWNQSGSIREPNSHKNVWPWVKFNEQIQVPIVRLDDWAEEHGLTHIDFIWADVQGAEIDLINGAKNTLKKTRFFYTEYSNDEWYKGQITLENLYNSLEDFSVSRVFGMDVLFENITLKKYIEYNLKLHIGGREHKEGWKILNIMQAPYVDFVGSISDLRQFPDESCAEIYASHVLEHVPQKDVLSTLKGIYRILKVGGKLSISVPDIDILCHSFINPLASVDEKFHIMRMIFGGQIDQFDFHFFGWNDVFLYDYLRNVGFVKFERVRSFNLFNDTSDYSPYGHPISLNVVAIK